MNKLSHGIAIKKFYFTHYKASFAYYNKNQNWHDAEIKQKTLFRWVIKYEHDLSTCASDEIVKFDPKVTKGLKVIIIKKAIELGNCHSEAIRLVIA